ncbi:MAG: ParB N-terminal domain-containing protein [bacterium]|nr:ParB N-terminal domain-containing protein [bacterium]
MAKRKRLTPLGPEALGSPEDTPLETKSMFTSAPRRAAPIADVAAGAAATAALEELSERWSSARQDGRLVVELPLEEIELTYLERDRMAEDEDETAALRDSLRERGQQTPIEVVALPGRAAYGLLSGWRRCRALAALREETGEARFGTVLALLRRPEDAPAAYRAMIEENEIRANLSHYERARIVVRATDRGVFADDEAALSALFASVPRARRSKVRSFVGIVRALDGALRFPEALSERVGLDLAQALRDRPELVRQISSALKADPPQNATAERAVLNGFLETENPVEDPAPKQSQTTPSEPKPSPEILGEWSGLTLRRRGARLELDGAAADAAFEADLAAWLAQRLGR